MRKYSERARREKASALVFIVLSFVIGIALAAPLLPARAVSNHIVEMHDYYFLEQFLTVGPGDTVQWHNLGAIEHSATSNTTAWTRVNVLAGQTSAQITMPTTPGNYTYICSFHFLTSGMWGSIIVSSAIPEFSSSFVVVAGMLVMALGLMLVRRKL